MDTGFDTKQLPDAPDAVAPDGAYDVPGAWPPTDADEMTHQAIEPIARFVGVSLDCADSAGHPFCITTITPPDA